MKFYNREIELEELNSIRERSHKNAQMSMMVGRRRIGKTSLLKHHIQGHLSIYLFVSKKNESLLCQEFLEESANQLNQRPHGNITTFRDLFAWLMDVSAEKPFTLVIDEFQEFLTINPAIMSEMQHIWDSKKDISKINLILCGSIYSIMKRIFESAKEPLFSRATAKIHVKAFNIPTIKLILKDFYPKYNNTDLLAFYMISGGVAKYVENLVMVNALSIEPILDEIFRENSLFIEEGKHVLIEEFGKDYTTYFSILSLIASSKTSRTEIESILETGIGGFLDRLENEFQVIEKIKPMFAKPNSRKVKYRIVDNFLSFWFRFIYKYRSAIEIGNFDYVKDIVKRDYAIFSGKILEKYFIQKFIESKRFSAVGSYWESANQNEIDIVAINEMENKIVLAEVKLNKSKINLAVLKEKSKNIVNKFPNYQIEYLALSVDDM